MFNKIQGYAGEEIIFLGIELKKSLLRMISNSVGSKTPREVLGIHFKSHV